MSSEQVYGGAAAPLGVGTQTLDALMDAERFDEAMAAFLDLAQPSRDPDDYIVRFRFNGQFAGDAYMDLMHPFTATIHQVSEPAFADCADADHQTEVARLKGFFLHPFKPEGGMVDAEELDEAFDSIDSNTYTMFEAIDPDDPWMPSLQIREALEEAAVGGTSMFLLELESHERWRGTKAAGALLAYVLHRCRGNAGWAVLRPFPMYPRPVDGELVGEEPTEQEVEAAIAKLTGYYESFGFVQVPGTDLMAIAFCVDHCRKWASYLVPRPRR